MATYVTSSSTDAEVNAAIDDNADYDVESNTDKAKQFIVACRIWLRRTVTEGRSAEHSLRQEHARIQNELAKAEQWLRVNDSSSTLGNRGHVRYLDISEGFR